MSSKSEKERQKQIQDKCLAVLGQLLRDEDNKYCVDCDAKGPRWASWNLGIFLCIRCAGIHRNLGVHISKVKSVNLDSWTPEQVAYLQEMGNSRARAVYEANLPDNFRRPQTDSSLEAFIRSKYETKKYIAKEWVPPQISKLVFEFDDEKKRSKSEKKTAKSTALEVRPPVSAKKPDPDVVELSKSTARPKTSGAADLLELNEISSARPPPVDDLFGGFMSAETSQVSSTGTNSIPVPGAELAELVDDIDQGNLFTQSADGLKKQPLSNESILSLYNQGGNAPQPQMMGMPLGNPYMGQPQGVYNQPLGGAIPPFRHNGVPAGGNIAFGGPAPNVPLNSGNLGTNPFLGPGVCTSYGSWYPPTNHSPHQIQLQMASLNLGQPQYPGMVSHQAQPNPNVSWTGQQPGHTLSVNLWK